MEENNFEDFEEDNDLLIRAKWIMDGSTTLEEAIKNVKEFASYLEGLAKEGWELSGEITDDYGFLEQKTSSE